MKRRRNYWFEDCVTYLTRQDWAGTFPTEPVTGLALTDEMLTLLNGDLYEKPEDAPSVSAYTQGENQGVLLVNMMGVDYDDRCGIRSSTSSPSRKCLADLQQLRHRQGLLHRQARLSRRRRPGRIGGYTDRFPEEYGKNLQTTSFPNESLLAPPSTRT